MKTEHTTIIIDNILKKIPNNIKPVPYLMDLLDLSRKSIYRRLQGEIPFTMDEIALLSSNLGFSIDEIVDQIDKNRISFTLNTKELSDSNKSFLYSLNQYYEYLRKALDAENSEIIITANCLRVFCTTELDNLFRFFYYRWNHQTGVVPLNYYFSDAHLPDEINSLRNKINDIITHIDNTTVILDNNVFLNVIKQIQYYYKRGLISDAELILLKNDLFIFLNSISSQMKNGMNENGCVNHFYLSLFDIECNMRYIKADNHTFANFSVYYTNEIIIKASKMSIVHKQWLESLKKYAIRISGSNEMELARFYNQQRYYIENMTEIMY